MNDTIRSIKGRRSIRRYQDKQIEDRDLQLILEAAAYAPSGSNNQSWLFTAIQNRDLLDTLNGMVRRAFLEMDLDENAYPAKIAAKRMAKSDKYNFYYHAPTLIVVSNAANYANAMADCSCALQNIFLAAHSLGLGSCWINQLRWLNDDAGIRSFLAGFGIGSDRVICGSAAIGYIEGDIPVAKPRKANTIQVIK